MRRYTKLWNCIAIVVVRHVKNRPETSVFNIWADCCFSPIIFLEFETLPKEKILHFRSLIERLWARIEIIGQTSKSSIKPVEWSWFITADAATEKVTWNAGGITCFHWHEPTYSVEIISDIVMRHIWGHLELILVCVPKNKNWFWGDAIALLKDSVIFCAREEEY